jgi:hypothetical protein
LVDVVVDVVVVVVVVFVVVVVVFVALMVNQKDVILLSSLNEVPMFESVSTDQHTQEGIFCRHRCHDCS